MDCLKEQLKNVKELVPLAPYTTFKIGGAARFFFVATAREDVIQATRAATDCNVPFFVLAGGSNILISDDGFPGLVVLIKLGAYQITGTKVTAEAGVEMETLVKETGKLGLSGFEWAGGLPGSLGGAVRGNAGAFGGEIKDSIVSVTALDTKGNTRELSKEDCKFSYRSSMLKENKWIVLSATFQLKEGDKKEIAGIAESHVEYRKEKHPLEYPNAGSMFKNCDVNLFTKELQEQLKDVVKVDPFPVVPTAYLISEAKLKGLRKGDAQVSTKHPNYMVNLGKATSKDVLELLEDVKTAVREKFSVELEEEVELVS